MEMELYTNEHGFLEELLSLDHEIHYYQTHDMIINTTTDLSYYDCLANDNFDFPIKNTSFQDNDTNFPITDQTLCSWPPQLHSQTLPYDYSSMSFIDDEDGGGGPALLGNELLAQNIMDPCKDESGPEMPGFNVGFCPEESGRKKKKKVSNGQPSKNLMAERRRRKRLNDRLSMLRSVVPKISKMDRTSILGDTIDYMKELLDRINGLQEEMDVGSNQLTLMTILNDLKPKEISIRNSPKFEVIRRGDLETKIEIGCGTKPGLLLSTVTTLEALGLEIQHCVISCFSDFAMQASCTSQELKQREILDSEGIKQALVRNAGFGGRCL